MGALCAASSDAATDAPGTEKFNPVDESIEKDKQAAQAAEQEAAAEAEKQAREAEAKVKEEEAKAEEAAKEEAEAARQKAEEAEELRKQAEAEETAKKQAEETAAKSAKSGADTKAKQSSKKAETGKEKKTADAKSKTSSEVKSGLTTHELELVEESWELVKGLGFETVGVLLFKKIFEAAPEALQLFKFKDENDLYASEALKKHGAFVVETVGVCVAGLKDFKKLVPVLQDLGKKHVDWGVLPPHYDVVGGAFIGTLRAGLGDAFSSELEAVWKKTYGALASEMKGTLYEDKKDEKKKAGTKSKAKSQAKSKAAEKPKEPAKVEEVPEFEFEALQGTSVTSVQRSWDIVLKNKAKQVGTMLSTKVVEMAPETIEMFDEKECRKLVDLLTKVIGGCKFFKNLVPDLIEAGKRLEAKRAKANHYEILGKALVSTIEDALAKKATPLHPDIKAMYELLWRNVVKVWNGDCKPKEA